MENDRYIEVKMAKPHMEMQWFLRGYKSWGSHNFKCN